MADWAYALSQGLGAGAQSGVNSLDMQIKDQMQANAEARAADLKLDTDQRLLAIQDAMKNRAAERFAGIVRDKLGEQVPQEADQVGTTGITHDSAEGAGLTMGGLQMDPATMKQYVVQAQGTLASPTATDEQRENARMVLDQIGKQAAAQQGINDAAVEGKMRPRTMDEAKDAAIDYALANDPAAYIAGTGMINAAEEPDRLDKRLDNQTKVAQIRADAMEKNADRRATATENAAQTRADALIERLGSGAAAAHVQTMQFLMDHGSTFEQARDAVLGTGEGAHKDPVAMASQMASQLIANGAVRLDKNDPPGTTVAGKAMQMAIDQIGIAQGRFRAPASPGAPVPGSWQDAKNPAAKNDPLGLFNK